jgi:hypothetical protein
MDIMKLIDEYAIYRSVLKDINNKLCRDKIQSHISAMQEVCDAAIKCKRLGMNPDLYDAVAKLED